MRHFPSKAIVNIQFVLFICLFLNPYKSFTQEEQKVVPDGTEGEVLTVPSQDTNAVKKENLKFNEFNPGFTTLKLGVGFLYEYGAFSQDEIGVAQMDSADVVLEAAFKARDFRFLVSDKLNAYGFGVLERLNLKGTTQFFQTRLQIAIL